jgi:hypothetical protein
MPGKSTYQEAQTILAPLSNVSYLADFSPSVGHISPYYAEGSLTISTSIGFVADSGNNIVSDISFILQALKVTQAGNDEIFDSEIFRKQANAYMLPHLLTEQGIPSAVIISTVAEQPTRGEQAGFYLLLLYPERGVLVRYTTQWRLAGKNVLGCMSDAHVELKLYSSELHPSEQGDSFSKFLAQTPWANMWPVPINDLYYKPIEKATSMTLKQFYDTFRQPTGECIETPAKLWPTPEP